MTFAPGQSGNPTGAKKSTAHIRELARAYTPEAISALRKALKRPGERVSAATVLLAYGYGKPQSNVNVRVIHSIEDLSDEELAAIAHAEGPPMIEGQAEAADEADEEGDC